MPTENQTQAPDAIRAALDRLQQLEARQGFDNPAAPALIASSRLALDNLCARLAALEACAEAARDCRDTLAALPDCAALLDSLADLDT